ncbi:hypothetical protein GCM10027600_24350 [Nocardioides ginsengisegetis]
MVDIDIVGRVVASVGSEHAITLSLSGGAEVRIETVSEFTEPDRPQLVIDPQHLETDQELQRVLPGRIVEQVAVDADAGSLVVTLEGGVDLRVLPDIDFEAWSLTLDDGSSYVCLPGGGLGRWGPRH